MAARVLDPIEQALGLDFDQLVRRYKSRDATLESEMATFLPTWTDIRDYLGPRSARFKGEITNQGQRQDQKMINNSPSFAVRALPAGLQSGVTSPMRPWFRLGLGGSDLQDFKPVKLWLAHVEDVIRQIFARSNIYDRLQANYNILGLYGTGALGIDEDDDTILRARDYPMGSFKLALDDSLRVNSVYRDTTMTVDQLVTRFKDRVSKKVQEQYDKGDYDIRYPICHIVEPNRSYKIGNRLSRHRKFASIYMDASLSGAEAILSYRGSDFMPILTPRWDILGENTYGFGCGELTLGDGKQLQIMERRKLQMIDKNASPTMVADASLRSQRTNNMPNSTVYVSGMITGKDGYKPAYVPNPYINEIREEIQRIEGHVDEGFFKNLFLQVTEIADQPNITATQINALREEKLMMLGPVLGRINTEQNDPLIDIAFDAAWNRGMIMPPPKEIAGMPLKVEYVSILAQAQKAIGLGNIERVVNFIGGLAKISGSPEPFDKLNVDETIDHYADGNGVAPAIIRSNDEAAQIRGGRDTKANAATALAAGQQGADIAATMASADMSGENALTRAMDVVGGPT